MATNGLVVMTPTSIDYTGTSASIGGNGSVSFSAVSSLSLNDVFSADYDNYMMILYIYQPGSSNSPGMRLRANGSDTTGSNYNEQYLGANNTTVTAGRYTADNRFYPLFAYLGTRNAITMNIFSPFLSQPTAIRNVSVDGSAGANIYDQTLLHSLAASYDGTTLSVGSGSITGLVTMFGFNQ